MREINWIVVHCSATGPRSDIGAKEIRQMHLARGWKDIGYHFVIRQNGWIENGRDLDGDGDTEEHIGAHVSGFNSDSIGICYVGGLNQFGEGKDTRTSNQKLSLMAILQSARAKYPNAKIVGHRDLSPDKDGDGEVESHEWLKLCPCFNATEEYAWI